MKPRFLFYFTNEPQRVALDDRARTARMLRAYRRSRTMYQLTRTAQHAYQLTVRGFADTVTIKQEQTT